MRVHECLYVNKFNHIQRSCLFRIFGQNRSIYGCFKISFWTF